MFTLVILEDEHIIIEGLKKLMPWEKYDIHLAGYALDGPSGFDMVMDKAPDIVLTDIRMPGMSGLDIIEKVKYVLPNTIFIIMSGYSDFEYAKKAIALGVVDYLVKPITIDSIGDVLQKSINIIKQRSLLHNMKKNNDVYAKNAFAVTLLNLLESNRVSPDEKERIKESYPAVFDENMFCRIFTSQISRWDEDYINLLADVKNIVDTVFKPSFVQQYFLIQDMQFIVYLYAPEQKYLEEKTLNPLLIEIKVRCNKRDIDFCGGISKIFTGEAQMKTAYMEAKEALRMAIFSESSNIIPYENMQDFNLMPENYIEIQDKISRCLREGNKSETLKLAEHFMDNFQKKDYMPNAIHHYVLEFVYTGLKIARESGQEFIRCNGNICLPYQEISYITNFKELCQWVLQLFEEINQWIYDIQNNGVDKSILKAKEYIDKNYSKDLTLFELASVVYMNPSYFSSIFKSAMNITYIKYLTKVRMEKAEELLRQGMKVYDISLAVGYPNYRYFCEIFKKYHGMTAQQYKKLV